MYGRCTQPSALVTFTGTQVVYCATGDSCCVSLGPGRGDNWGSRCFHTLIRKALLLRTTGNSDSGIVDMGVSVHCLHIHHMEKIDATLFRY
jgi:hypothetical protein